MTNKNEVGTDYPGGWLQRLESLLPPEIYEDLHKRVEVLRHASNMVERAREAAARDGAGAATDFFIRVAAGAFREADLQSKSCKLRGPV